MRKVEPLDVDFIGTGRQLTEEEHNLIGDAIAKDKERRRKAEERRQNRVEAKRKTAKAG